MTINAILEDSMIDSALTAAKTQESASTGQIRALQTTDWEAFCEQGRRVYDVIQKAQWHLGAMVASIEKDYGGYSIEDFAREVGISKSYAYDLRKVWGTFSTQVENYDSQVITWSHYREAEKLKDVDAALDILDLAVIGADFPEYVLDVDKQHVERKSGSPWTCGEVELVVIALKGKPVKNLPIFDRTLLGGLVGTISFQHLDVDWDKSYHIVVIEVQT